MLLAVVTSSMATIIFYFMFGFLYKKQKKKRVEIKIVEQVVGKKIPKELRVKILNNALYYYAFLFFMANFVAFYAKTILLLTIFSLLIFMGGLFIGAKILIWYSKKITVK